MYLTPLQTFIMIIAIALGVIITRFAPFVLFPDGKQTPDLIIYLGNVLPPAMMGLLVVYQLKGVALASYPHAIPEFIAVAFVAVIQYWKRNVLLSIGLGTVLYMVLVQEVFLFG